MLVLHHLSETYGHSGDGYGSILPQLDGIQSLIAGDISAMHCINSPTVDLSKMPTPKSASLRECEVYRGGGRK